MKRNHEGYIMFTPWVDSFPNLLWSDDWRSCVCICHILSIYR